MTKLLNIFTCQDTQNDEDCSHFQDVCLEKDREKCEGWHKQYGVEFDIGCTLTVMREVEGR